MSKHTRVSRSQWILAVAGLAMAATTAFAADGARDKRYHIRNWTTKNASDCHLYFSGQPTSTPDNQPFDQADVPPDGKRVDYSGGSIGSGKNFDPRVVLKWASGDDPPVLTKVEWTFPTGPAEVVERGTKEFDKYVKGFTGIEWFDYTDLGAVTFNMQGSAFDLVYQLSDLKIYAMPLSAWHDETTRIDPSLGTAKFIAPDLTIVGQGQTVSIALGNFGEGMYGLATIGALTVVDQSFRDTIVYPVPQHCADAYQIPSPAGTIVLATAALFLNRRRR